MPMHTVKNHLKKNVTWQLARIPLYLLFSKFLYDAVMKTKERFKLLTSPVGKMLGRSSRYQPEYS